MDEAPRVLCMGVTGGLIAEVSPAAGVTAGLSPHSIGCVIARTAKTLTKRRAVDFCHVATAICPRAALL
jgi:hypothetical protein